jgi:integrase
MRRNQLRPDVADIAWPLLREELRAEELSLNTVWNHFRNFLYACELLQGDVPDVRTAMIGPMQSAWCGYDGTPPQKEGVRFALIQLFSALFMLAERDPSINRKEMLNIIVWLRTKVRLPAQTVDKNFLTEGELDHLIYCSLLDIKDGIEFSKIHPNLQTMTTRRDRAINAAPVVNWSVALMTLLMAFTGLRHSSVTGMNVNDWMELNEHFSSIIWHHKKKREEDLVFTPVMLIRLLECYVRATDKIREALGTKRVFLTGTNIGDWIACPDQHTLNHYLQDFVQRHRLVRGEVPIALSSVILRRTYATHQLYKGRSLWFIRTQFGHTSISHTKDYVQFDRYEHPAQVGKALDEYGRRVLNLWHKPVVPENLAPDQRATVFNDWRDYPKDKVSNQIDNDASIISALVPCSTCDSLMTGKEFFEGWYKERIEREERLQRLDTDSEAVDVYEKEQSEFQHFMKNYILVKEDYEKWAG